jgi:hypothetical protein
MGFLEMVEGARPVDDGKYKATVKLSINNNGEGEIFHPSSVDISFEVGYEDRSWGAMKDIVLMLPTDLLVSYEDEDGNSKDLKVDLNELDKEWESSNFLAPVELDLYLDKEGLVDKKLSTLTCAFSMPS